MKYKEVEDHIAAYKMNHGETPKLSVAKIEEIAKQMKIEILELSLDFVLRSEQWQIVAKANESFVESVFYPDVNIEIIGVNFDTREIHMIVNPV